MRFTIKNSRGESPERAFGHWDIGTRDIRGPEVEEVGTCQVPKQ
jgi:hypothetical protein